MSALTFFLRLFLGGLFAFIPVFSALIAIVVVTLAAEGLFTRRDFLGAPTCFSFAMTLGGLRGSVGPNDVSISRVVVAESVA